MLSWLSDLEISILLWIQKNHTNSVLDNFFPIYTDLYKITGFMIPVIGLLLFFFIRKFKRTGLTYFLFLCLSLGLSDFAGKITKNNFPRQRPFTESHLGIIAKSPAGPTSSFYSNHASNMFTFATYTAHFFPAGKVFLFTLAGLTAYSRLYNGVHYPSDVLVGMLLGIMIGYFMAHFSKYIIRKIKLKDHTL